MLPEKETRVDLKYLIDLKVKMKSFQIKEEELRRSLDIESDNKEYKMLQTELDEHLNSFEALEAALVKEEAKMINLDRGIYKGIAINVRDKDMIKFPLYFKWANTVNHVGYSGTTRVGKTKNMINDADQLIKKGWDVFVIDPKGGEGQEILTEVIQSTLMANRPEDFKYLSPAFPEDSEYVNLLYGMGDDEAASLIKTFAEAISDDAFFTAVVFENTLAALKALSFIEAATDPDGAYTKYLEESEMQKYIALKNIKDGSKKMITDRWNRASNPNELHISTKKTTKLKDFEFATLNPSKTLYQNRSMATFKILGNYTTFESLENLKLTIDSLITVPPMETIGAENYMRIMKLRGEALSLLIKVLSVDKTTFSKIAKTHSVMLSQLVYGDIGEVFSGIGINPIANRLLSEDRGLVCVMQPFPMRYKTISNVSVMAMLKAIESVMGLVGSSGRSLKRKVAVMIDEAGAVAYKGIEQLFNKAGGLGVSLFVYTQTKEDYNLSIGETNANVMMDNVNTTIVMKMNHLKSCKEAAELIGTVRKNESMYMSSEGGGNRFSIGSEDVQIALAEDIAEQPIGTGYLRHDGNVYNVDFPYVKGIKNSPVKMPILENEAKRKYLSEYESLLLSNLSQSV